MTLWEFALAAWRRPDVGPICIELQDRHGQCVALLLWAAWTAVEGRPTGAALTRRAVALARPWEGEVIAPLRKARRGLRNSDKVSDTDTRARLGAAVRAAELDAERALMDALGGLSPVPIGAPAGLERRLAEVMNAWNGAMAPELAAALAKSMG